MPLKSWREARKSILSSQKEYDELALLSGLIIFFVTKMSYHRIIMSSVFFFIIHSYSHDKNYDKRGKWTKLIHSHDRKYYIKLTCDRRVFLWWHLLMASVWLVYLHQFFMCLIKDPSWAEPWEKHPLKIVQTKRRETGSFCSMRSLEKLPD